MLLAETPAMPDVLGSTPPSYTRIIEPARDVHHLLDPPLTDGEAAVIDILDGVLPPAWEIYVQPPLNGLRPDVVLLNPHAGVIVLEIKDWHLRDERYRVVAQDGRAEIWRSVEGHEERIRNPVDQLQAYRTEVAELYCASARRRFGKAPTGAAVVFPFASDAEVASVFDARASQHLPRGDRDVLVLAGFEALAEGTLERLVPSALRLSSTGLQPALLNDLRRWLVEPDFALIRREPPALTPRQRDFASRRTTSGFRRLRGPAGSGKTLVVAARAAALQRDEKDVLVLTYTKTLPTYIRDVSIGFGCDGRRVTWLHFHGWCKRVLELAGQRFPSTNEGNVFDSVVPEQVNDVLDSELGLRVDRYDAILVDEGQDFHPNWWATLRRVLRPGGEMLLAADRAQDIFEKNGFWTEQAMIGAGFSGPWSEFAESFRMPAQLTQLARRYTELFFPETDLRPTVPQGALDVDVCRLRWVQTGAEDLLSEAVRGVLDVLAAAPDARPLSPADVVVVVDRNATGLELVKRLGAYGIDVVHTFNGDRCRFTPGGTCAEGHHCPRLQRLGVASCRRSARGRIEGVRAPTRLYRNDAVEGALPRKLSHDRVR